MSETLDFRSLYAGFDAPILDIDCGSKCAPFNGGVPVCCDTRHSVPAAYHAEWVFLRDQTDLWHLWEPEDGDEHARLAREAGTELVLIECQGADHCIRAFRSLVCRAFPFFPYVDSQGLFLGISYYWEYEDRCWVLSNLDRVSPVYREEFILTYERVFKARPDELESFQQHAARMREVFAGDRRSIPLLHRNGVWHWIDPESERMTRAAPAKFEKFPPFDISDTLLFPDEL